MLNIWVTPKQVKYTNAANSIQTSGFISRLIHYSEVTCKSHTVKQRKWSVMSYSNWNLSAVSCKLLGLRVRVPLSRSYMSLQYHTETNKQTKTLEIMNTTWQRFPEDYLLLFICLHKHLFLWYKKRAYRMCNQWESMSMEASEEHLEVFCELEAHKIWCIKPSG